MKRILIIGIGAGDPEQITIQAVNALNRVDVFFLLDKGAAKSELTDLRREVCRRYINDHPYRFVDADSPDWDRSTTTYLSTVEALNKDKQALFKRLISEEMVDGETGAFLIWGDPSLYDSTIRNLNAIASADFVEFFYEVIPGISSIQALAAQHGITLTSISGSVEITTGRKMAAATLEPARSVVVMLDGDNAYRHLSGHDVEIYWGAYLGTPDQILISGKLEDVSARIQQACEDARRAKGWIMDTYLVRRSEET